MIVFQTEGDQGETLKIHFCEKGLYVEIELNDGSNEMANAIISIDDMPELIKFLQDGLA